jgi:hypothetical protein
VTPEYITSKLSLLPQFEVVSLNHREKGRVTILQGYFSSPIGNEEQGANLFLPDLRFLDGLLTSANQGEHLRTIQTGGYSWSEIYEREVLGTHLAFFSNYDARHLKLALDPEIVWNKSNFVPRMAIQTHMIGTDGKPYRCLSPYEEGTPLKEGESIVEAGWDHEHCVFCWRTIDLENVGYSGSSNDDEEWACDWCYRQAIEPHDPRPLLLPYKSRDFDL